MRNVLKWCGTRWRVSFSSMWCREMVNKPFLKWAIFCSQEWRSAGRETPFRPASFTTAEM